MFLKIKANNFICFYRTTLNNNDISIVEDEFNINLSLINEISIKQCLIKVNKNNKTFKFKYKIEFDRFCEDGVLNYFTLFFKNKENKEFKRINNIIQNNIYKEIK